MRLAARRDLRCRRGGRTSSPTAARARRPSSCCRASANTTSSRSLEERAPKASAAISPSPVHRDRRAALCSRQGASLILGLRAERSTATCAARCTAACSPRSPTSRSATPWRSPPAADRRGDCQSEPRLRRRRARRRLARSAVESKNRAAGSRSATATSPAATSASCARAPCSWSPDSLAGKLETRHRPAGPAPLLAVRARVDGGPALVGDPAESTSSESSSTSSSRSSPVPSPT